MLEWLVNTYSTTFLPLTDSYNMTLLLRPHPSIIPMASVIKRDWKVVCISNVTGCYSFISHEQLLIAFKADTHIPTLQVKEKLGVPGF